MLDPETNESGSTALLSGDPTDKVPVQISLVVFFTSSVNFKGSAQKWKKY
jgi:hypothetical protein